MNNEFNINTVADWIVANPEINRLLCSWIASRDSELAMRMAFDLEAHADHYNDVSFDDSMDGDYDSSMASSGFGTDEDYGSFDAGSDL